MMAMVRSGPRCEPSRFGPPNGAGSSSLSPISSPRHLLVLDLDETLVHTSAILKGRCDLVLRNVTMSPGEAPRTCYVHYRPRLIPFLQEAARLFDVCVFTAGTQPYADQVLDHIDPSRSVVHYRLYRHHCEAHPGTLGHGYSYVKNIARLGRPLSQVIIADDSPASYQLQPQNGIAVPPWTGEDRKDTFLLGTLMQWLRRLATKDDVIPTLAEIGNRTLQP